MVSLDWCGKQTKGIRIGKPSEALADEYMRLAEETLDVLKSIREKSPVWLSTMNYYCKYYALYGLVVRCGVTSEIHDCTLLLCQELENGGFIPSGITQQLIKDKKLRIDNQYYLKNRVVAVELEELREFVLLFGQLIKHYKPVYLFLRKRVAI